MKTALTTEQKATQTLHTTQWINSLTPGTQFTKKEIDEEIGPINNKIKRDVIENAKKRGDVKQPAHGLYIKIGQPILKLGYELREPQSILSLPYGLQDVLIDSKDIIVLVGEKGTYKTTVALNFAAEIAIGGHKVHYYMIEGEGTVKKRLRLIAPDLLYSPNFNFASLRQIDPTLYRIGDESKRAIVFLDFLELGTAWHTAAIEMRQMQAILQEGAVLFIIMQGKTSQHSKHKVPMPFGGRIPTFLASLVLTIVFDKEDNERLHPYLYISHVRERDDDKASKTDGGLPTLDHTKIKLNFDPQTRVITFNKKIPPSEYE